MGTNLVFLHVLHQLNSCFQAWIDYPTQKQVLEGGGLGGGSTTKSQASKMYGLDYPQSHEKKLKS